MKKMLIFIIAILSIFALVIILTNKETKNEKTTSTEQVNYYKNQITPEQLQEDLSDHKEKIVYFYKTTCPHCLRVSPIVVPMAENMKINMQVLNLEEYKQGWDMFQIKGTPTIISYKDGKEVNRILGEQSLQTFQTWFKNNK
ncbi:MULTISPECIES: thioredoxin family protein [Bacillus cereus group]|uniref:thioredoxin family protein n=1 Tax=Bacillus cereus group TaxID=86661 RepID=UPI000BF27746|nr:MULTISPECIES: thioredoxin family protein [Bacillus cereus group]PER09760.1 thioredoxin family protein [Bacillus cereus]PET18121.1 thioredoxin family protein [Bacillus cereus]PET65295.1 thioredoxin family protein [Bacillus cereus]PEZ27425.1 thioredoxin family protein [Bacillus cereus]PFH63765.1 thioredoxin family protein [Bacillus cereus]